MAQDLELQNLIREIHGTMRVLDERTQSILRQAEKTNGRVTKLEDKTDAVEKEQEGLAVKVGAIATIAGTIITTIITSMFK